MTKLVCRYLMIFVVYVCISEANECKRKIQQFLTGPQVMHFMPHEFDRGAAPALLHELQAANCRSALEASDTNESIKAACTNTCRP